MFSTDIQYLTLPSTARSKIDLYYRKVLAASPVSTLIIGNLLKYDSYMKKWGTNGKQ